MPVIHERFAHIVPVEEGSHIYKASTDEGAISAVQVFPLQLTSDRQEVFQQRVALLTQAVVEFKAVVPKPLGWGLTRTDFHPFLEMEWVEGVSLEQGRGRQRTAVRPMNEVLSVAEQVSRILTLCHNLGLPHGRLGPGNILWDNRESRYTLSGFDLVWQPGAEHLASLPNLSPEKAEANALEKTKAGLFQQDIEQLGRVLVLMLTGAESPVTFDAETVRKARAAAVPSSWPEEETNIPNWLVAALSKAMSNGAEQRYVHAGDLYMAIIKHHHTQLPAERRFRSQPQVVATKPLIQKPETVTAPPSYEMPVEKKKGLSNAVIGVGALLVALVAGYLLFSQPGSARGNVATTTLGSTSEQQGSDPAVANVEVQPKKEVKPVAKEKKAPKKVVKKPEVKEEPPVVVADSTMAQEAAEPEQVEPTAATGAYKVRSKAYFHNEPDEATRRRAFIVHWNNAVLRPLQEENDFVYIVFTNAEGQTSKGWLKKSDLVPVNE